MDIEEYIEKIVENGRLEDMEKLSELLEDTMEIIKDYDNSCYKNFEMELYKMAYGNTLNKEMADEIISKMRPYGKKWDIEQTKKLQMERGLNNISNVDFYIVMNSAYNDYNNIFGEDVESYIRFTLDFIEDEDAKTDKVFIYYTEIPE